MGNGLKWATMNVGASNPEDFGEYFAWGEIAAKQNYTWDTYFDTKNSGASFTKYDKNGGKTVLDLINDAARSKWGVPWRIPTREEWKWLNTKDNCDWVWKEDYNNSGINGVLVTSKINGNSIFLPAAGYMSGEKLLRASGDPEGQIGCYWSSSPVTTLKTWTNAWHMNCGPGPSSMIGTNRRFGYSVRPVAE